MVASLLPPSPIPSSQSAGTFPTADTCRRGSRPAPAVYARRTDVKSAGRTRGSWGPAASPAQSDRDVARRQALERALASGAWRELTNVEPLFATDLEWPACGQLRHRLDALADGAATGGLPEVAQSDHRHLAGRPSPWCRHPSGVKNGPSATAITAVKYPGGEAAFSWTAGPTWPAAGAL